MDNEADDKIERGAIKSRYIFMIAVLSGVLYAVVLPYFGIDLGLNWARKDIVVFGSMDDCITDARFSEAHCRAQFAEATELHEALAPRYANMPLCAEAHGGQCAAVSRRALMSASLGAFAPKPMAWFIGPPGSDAVTPQFIYGSHEDGVLQTANRYPIKGGLGDLKVSRLALRLPEGRTYDLGGTRIQVR